MCIFYYYYVKKQDFSHMDDNFFIVFRELSLNIYFIIYCFAHINVRSWLPKNNYNYYIYWYTQTYIKNYNKIYLYKFFYWQNLGRNITAGQKYILEKTWQLDKRWYNWRTVHQNYWTTCSTTKNNFNVDLWHTLLNFYLCVAKKVLKNS